MIGSAVVPYLASQGHEITGWFGMRQVLGRYFGIQIRGKSILNAWKDLMGL